MAEEAKIEKNPNHDRTRYNHAVGNMRHMESTMDVLEPIMEIETARLKSLYVNRL